MPARAGGVALKLDTKDLSALYQTAKAAPGKIQVELRRGITKSTKPLEDAIRAEAAFSSRIPDAVRSRVSFAKGGASVTVYVDPKKAPEAAAINNGGKSGTFRHPVWGNTDVWVSQEARPFFTTGTVKAQTQVARAMQDVMDAIAKDLGFK